MNTDFKAGIVRILKKDDATAGTGFVVSDEGLIATCAHVVQYAGAGPGDTVRVFFHTAQEELEARVEPDWWPDSSPKDVAILRLKAGLPNEVTSLPLGSSADAEGGTFRTFGFPKVKSVEGMAGRCEVVDRTTEAGFPVLQLRSSEVSPGFSGAPVWSDDFGVVVGMVVSIAPEDRYGRQAETAFIIPVETLRVVCPALRLPEGEPYRGLQVFEAEHADLYFGREDDTRELMTRLCHHDVVLLVGVSGSGKSSLVRAGLEKGLKAHPVPGLVEMAPCITLPGRESLLNLLLDLSCQVEELDTEIVANAFELPDNALAEDYREATAEALRLRTPQALATALRACAPPQGFLLIVDQFERLYTECSDEANQSLFIETLLAVTGDSAKVLIVLRADFYEQALQRSGLGQILKANRTVHLLQMKPAELTAAIEEPARAFVRRLQPGLTERLVSDVQDRAGDLPLLEFALTELWKKDNEDGVLTLASYEKLGYSDPDGQGFPGLQGAIAQRASRVWEELNEDERRACRSVFVILATQRQADVWKQPTARDISRRAWQAEWDEPTGSVVGKLVDARLLTADRDTVSKQPTIELAHEALIRAWPRLQGWLTKYHNFVVWYNHDLVPFLQRWLKNEKNPDLLLPPAELENARPLLEDYAEELPGTCWVEYVRASIAKQAAEERHKRMIMGAIAVAVVVIVVVVLVSYLRGARQQEQVEQQARMARSAISNQLAVQSLDVLEEAPQQSLLLAAEAVSVTMRMGEPVTRAAENALRKALEHSGGRGLSGHGSAISALTIGPYSRLLITGSANGAIGLWSLASSESPSCGAITHGHESEVTVVAISPNGERLVTGDADGGMLVWALDGPDQLSRTNSLPRRDESITAIAVSPDNQWLVAGTETGQISLWPQAAADSTSEPILLPGHQDTITDLSFSPDSRWLMTVSSDGVALRWDLMEEQPASGAWGFSDKDVSLTSISLSPDGHWMASGNAEGKTLLWDLSSNEAEPPATPLPSKGGTSIITAFSADSSRLLIVNENDVVNVWAPHPTEPYTTTHSFSIDWSVNPESFFLGGPENHWLIGTAATDQKAYLLDMDSAPPHHESNTKRPPEPASLCGHDGSITAAATSLDGRWLVTGSADTTIRVWDLNFLRTSAVPFQLSNDAIEENAIAISHNGNWLAIAEDKAISMWNLDARDLLTPTAVLTGSNAGLTAMSISRDAHWIAAGDWDGYTYLWDWTSSSPNGTLVRLTEHGDDKIAALSMSPDGRWLAGSWDKTTRVWRLGDGHVGELVRELPPHNAKITTQAISPDSRWLVTASEDTTARLWLLQSIESASSDHESLPHTRDVTAVAFSPNSRWLATASLDGSVHLWDLKASKLSTETIRYDEHAGEITSLAFSKDGGWLITGSEDTTARVWTVTPEGTITRSLSYPGHNDAVRAVAASPRQSGFATASSDHTVRLWDWTRGPDFVPLVLDVHKQPVTSVAYSPDNHWLVTSSQDHTVQLWNLDLDELVRLACKTAGRNLSLLEWSQHFGDEPYSVICPGWPEPGDREQDGDTRPIDDISGTPPPPDACSLQPPAPDIAEAKIAFVSDRDGNSNVYVMDTNGSMQASLTEHTSDDLYPIWLPDNERILFTSNRSGQHRWYTVRTDGGGLKTFEFQVPQGATAIALSPDATKAAYALGSPGNWTVMINDKQGPSLESDELFLVWSGDSVHMTVEAKWVNDKSEEKTMRRIWVWNTEYPVMDPLTDDNYVAWNAAWSPDGQRIAFVSDRENDAEIYTRQSDGTDLQQLTLNTDLDQMPIWSPNGKWIVFYGVRNGEGAIYRMAPDGTDQKRLFIVPETYQPENLGLSWSPDGQWLCYCLESNGQRDIYRIHVQGGPPCRLTTDPSDDWSPSWSRPD